MSPIATDPSVAVGYVRCSSKDQIVSSTGERGLGLDAQERALKAFAKANGIELVQTFSEEGVSGGAPINERLQLVRALAAMRKHRAGQLIVHRLDRAGRSTLDLMTLEKLLTDSGAKLVSTQGEGTGDDSPFAKFTRSVMFAASELEKETLRLRIIAAFEGKRERGEWIGRPPAGHTCINGRLAPSRDWDKVLKALQMRKDGYRQREVAKATGYKQPFISRLEKRWSSPESFVAWSKEKCSK